MYTPEALAALRGNAIHIQSSSKPAPKQPEKKAGAAMEVENPSLEEEEEDEEGRDLPGKEEILKARRKREMMRAMGSKSSGSMPEFIPLKANGKAKAPLQSSDGQVYGVEEDEEHGGLVTENPEDVEQDVFDDNKGSRLFFGDPGKPAKGGRGGDRKAPADFDMERQAPAEEEDDEYKKWIDEQIRAGGAKMPRRQVATQAISDGKDRRSYRPSQSKTGTDVTAEMRRISESLSSLKENCAKGGRDLGQLDREIKQTQGDLEKFQIEMKTMNKRYLFYQRLRDKLSDCLDCLNTKAPVIEEAMVEMSELYTAQAKAKRQHFDLHTRDECEEAFGPKDAPTEKKLDEFGREVGMSFNLGKEQRAKDREAKREKFKNIGPKEEGLLTDDDEEVSGNRSDRRERLLREVDTIFADTEEDFKTFHAIKDQLELLKRNYQQAYTDTYISLSVPSLFAPYVRIELLKWEAMEKPRFDSMDWYNRMADYGLFGDISDGDPDLDVVPKLVEKVVIPYITTILFTIWNPLSERHFGGAESLVREALDHVDGKLEAPQNLLATVLDRFQAIINSHGKYPLVPEDKAESEKRQKQWNFCLKRWWRAVKILRQLVRWKSVLSSDVVRDLTLSHFDDNLVPLLVHQARQGRTTEVLNMARDAMEFLPIEWKGTAVKVVASACKKARVDSRVLTTIKDGLRQTS